MLIKLNALAAKASPRKDDGKMTVTFMLQPNPLMKEVPDQYRAFVVVDRVLELTDVIDLMEFRSSSISKADIMAVIEDFHYTIRRLLADGHKINTGLIVIELTIKGNFDGRDASFDTRSGHKVRVKIRLVKAVEDEVKQKVRLKKKPSTEPAPLIDFYRDLANNEGSNTTLTPTHMARLKGYKLKFDPSDDRLGVFLVPQAIGGILNDPNPVRVEHYSRTTNTEIIFRVPDDLPTSDYKLEVRALFGKEDIRTGTYKHTLVVL